MIEPLTPRQQTLIVNNVIRACEDIGQLNRQGYKFLYLCSGFIAHYDINGFKANYDQDVGYGLATAIRAHADANQWQNFSPRDDDYAYYMTKRAVYNRILAGLEQKELA